MFVKAVCNKKKVLVLFQNTTQKRIKFEKESIHRLPIKANNLLYLLN